MESLHQPRNKSKKGKKNKRIKKTTFIHGVTDWWKSDPVSLWLYSRFCLGMQISSNVSTTLASLDRRERQTVGRSIPKFKTNNKPERKTDVRPAKGAREIGTHEGWALGLAHARTNAQIRTTTDSVGNLGRGKKEEKADTEIRNGELSFFKNIPQI